MAQVRTKIKGEYTYPSEYTEVPEGALKLAKNMNINRDSIAEPRRGFKTYKAISASAADRVKQFLFYKSTMFAHYGSAIGKDSADPFAVMSGTFDPPSHGDSYVPRIKSIEAQSNLFFTSNTGIQKLDAVAGTIGAAGAPRGLDVNLTLSGVSGFMTDQTQVAYRLLWGIKDANNNVILGAPSQRAVIINTAGGTRDVIVNSSIPSVVTTSWFYQVYRTGVSSGATIDPNDEEGLVYEANPTSAEIAAKVISFTDSTPDSLRGATIYTAASQQGIAQANDVPPSAKDLALFKGMTLFGNTIQKQSLTVTMLGASGAAGVSYVSFTGNTTITSTTITTLSTTTGLAAGMSISGTGIPAATTIVSVNTGASTMVISAAATATNAGVALVANDVLTIGGTTYLAAAAEDVATRKFQVFTSGTPSQNIADTANSLVKVINRNTTNTTIYAYYASNVNELPGKIFLEARSLGASAFSCVASAHGSAWNPALPTSGTTVLSTSESKKNRLHVSKLQQPEACPRTQYYDIGSAEKALLRVIALRDAAVVMKEDGFFRVTGTTPQNIQIEPLDLNAVVIGPETACSLNNLVYAVTNQGISTASDVGVGVISRPIEDQISPKLGWSNFATTAFAVPYETERQYILFTPETAIETFATKQNVYNLFTTAWTRWYKPATIGAVNPADNKLYLGSSTTNNVLQERKDLLYTDYCDEDLAVTISSSSGTSIVLTDVTGITVGDVLTQGVLPFSEVTAISPSTNTLTMDVARGWANGAATIRTSYLCQIDFASNYMGNPGIMKHVREVHVLMKEAVFRTAKVIFSTDLIFSTDYVEISGYASYLWGYFPWGTVPWGGYSGNYKDRTWPPAEYQRCTWMNTTFRHQGSYSQFAIAGLEYTFEPLTERTGT